MPETTIDGVIQRLDLMTEAHRANGERSGYFAALYNEMTRAIKKGIDEGTFDDGPRMEILDVAFANRYFAAVDGYEGGSQISRTWFETFETNKHDEYLVFQNLLLGINAHINYDLGAAAARITRTEDLESLKDDFMRVNDILHSLIDEMQSRVNKLSPVLRLVDHIGGRIDEKLFEFSLVKSRDWAWSLTKELVILTPEDQEIRLIEVDKHIARLGRKIRNPGYLIEKGLWLARLFESKDVSANVAILT